jgi:phosphatidylserine/phosphatidylglycerophosphate/cardiolipin synthase-like enzyme
MITRTKKDLKVISPYIDTSFLQEIFSRQSQGVTVMIVTRPDKDFTGKDKIAALRYIKQYIKSNRKTNELVHSRVFIRDNEQALISSADITHDSLVGQFNAGVLLSDPSVIKKLLDYFVHVWDASL